MSKKDLLREKIQHLDLNTFDPTTLVEGMEKMAFQARNTARDAKIYERMGVNLSPATMACWVMKMGELVMPLLGIALEEIRGGDYAQMSETPF